MRSSRRFKTISQILILAMLHLCWGCAPFSVIGKDDLSPAELEKVQAVKVVGEWEGFCVLNCKKKLSDCIKSRGLMNKNEAQCETENNTCFQQCEMEESELSYTVIHKVKGVSCEKGTFVSYPRFQYRTYIEIGGGSRYEAIEQIKIRAARIGGHAIANISCTYDSLLIKNLGLCHTWLECEADVIRLDKYDADGNPIKNDGYIPKAMVEDDCDPGMESCD